MTLIDGTVYGTFGGHCDKVDPRLLQSVLFLANKFQVQLHGNDCRRKHDPRGWGY